MINPSWLLLQKWKIGSGLWMPERAVLQEAGNPMAFAYFHEIRFMLAAH